MLQGHLTAHHNTTHCGANLLPACTDTWVVKWYVQRKWRVLQCCPQLSVRCSKLAACNCLYSEQSPTFHTPQQHHWHSLTSRNMQRIILQVGPNANCPLFLSRLTTVAKFYYQNSPTSNKSVRSRWQFLQVARHDAAKWRVLQRFLANIERNYRVPVAETTPWSCRFGHLRSSQLYLCFTLYDRVFIRFSILSCACYMPRQPRLLSFYHVSNPWHGEQFPELVSECSFTASQFSIKSR